MKQLGLRVTIAQNTDYSERLARLEEFWRKIETAPEGAVIDRGEEEESELERARRRA